MVVCFLIVRAVWRFRHNLWHFAAHRGAPFVYMAFGWFSTLHALCVMCILYSFLSEGESRCAAIHVVWFSPADLRNRVWQGSG